MRDDDRRSVMRGGLMDHVSQKLHYGGGSVRSFFVEKVRRRARGLSRGASGGATTSESDVSTGGLGSGFGSHLSVIVDGKVGGGGSANSTSSSGVVREDSTRLQRLVTQMRDCLSEISSSSCSSSSLSSCPSPSSRRLPPPTDAQLEEWSCLIYESMSAPSRTFHGVQHVFDISVNADPVQTVSAFFHDVVYYSIDGGLSPGQAMRLEGIIDEEGIEGGGAAKKVSVKPERGFTTSMTSDEAKNASFDPGIALTLDLFGFVPEQTLNPFKGLNEFLSACLAVRCLGETLELNELAKIVVCIEATIPFRPKDAKGLTAMQHLYQRLRDANVKHDLHLSEDEIVQCIRRAADLANRDVENFASADRAHFLSNTWNLLPESNISLRHGRVFRIGDFSDALRKMTGFFSSLNPDVIYCSFRNVPTDKELADLTSKARSNIEAALKYMQCKLLSISVLAALAAKTGGDAPVALFLGDLPEPNRRSPSIEDRIHPLSPSDSAQHGHVDPKVYSLLRDGRDEESSFDIKNSPLAAYLYGLMGDEGLYDALRHAIHPMDEEGADAMLDSIPRVAVREIAEACAEIAITRTSALTKIAEMYAKEEEEETELESAAAARTEKGQCNG